MGRFSRSLEPEWLDTLGPGDPRAVRSRADLRRVNALMGNARLLARGLAAHLRPYGALRIADLGSGDGAVMLAVARRLKRPGVELLLVDRAPVVRDEGLHAFEDHGWTARAHEADALEFLEAPARFGAIVVNLFLHHLDPGRLAALLRLAAARTDLFVACEPARTGIALAGSRLLGLIGCNDVTRHDAVASVRAGFRGRELSSAWPRESGWHLDERPAWPFSHLFVARRRAHA